MELKERIVDTALRLFTDLGIKSVRMDDIASVCGISKRTLYEQFTDREHLVRQTIETYVKQQEAMLVGPMSRAENAIDEMWIMSGHGTEFKTSARNLMIDLLRFYPQIFEDIVRKYYEQIVACSEACLLVFADFGIDVVPLDHQRQGHAQHEESDQHDGDQNYDPCCTHSMTSRLFGRTCRPWMKKRSHPPDSRQIY